MLKSIKKIFNILAWPIFFGIITSLITFIFILLFNNNEINSLKTLCSTCTNAEIMNQFNQFITTSIYKTSLQSYLNQYSLVISLVVACFFLPTLLNKIKEKKTKIKLSSYIYIILLGITFSLICNITFYNVNSYIHFTSLFDYTNEFFIYRLLSLCLIGPILEELLFRGIVYNKLKTTTTPLKAILLSSTIFALFHFNLMQMLYAFALSFMLIYVYEKYKTIKAPITMHILANTSIFLFLPILNKNIIWLNLTVLFTSIIIIYLVFNKKLFFKE